MPPYPHEMGIDTDPRMAAGKLQAQGLIRYQRGRIAVLDRRGLEKTSCECYRFIRHQYAHSQRMLPRLLSRR